MIVFGSLGKAAGTRTRTNSKDNNYLHICNKSLCHAVTGGYWYPGIPKTVTADPPRAGDWAGIQIEATSPNSRLTYCRIQHAIVGISARTDAVQIESCLFSENNTGVLCESTNPTITRNEFNRNGIGSPKSKAARRQKSSIMNSRLTNTEFHVKMIPARVSNITSFVLIIENAITCYSTASPEIVSNNITMNIGWAVYDGGTAPRQFHSRQ